MQTLVNAVRAHANQKFSGGWDWIAECMTDKDIELNITGCGTVAEAIQKMQETADLYAETEMEFRF